MAKPSVPASRASVKLGTSARLSSRLPAILPESRIERMVQLIDHCSAAQAVADDLGEQFLSYLLAMAIQEARSTMRQSSL